MRVYGMAIVLSFPSHAQRLLTLAGFGLAIGGLAAFAAPPSRGVTLGGQEGLYTKSQWKLDWPGCAFEGGITQGRVEKMPADPAAGMGPALRVHFAPGEIGPEEGGAGWRWPIGRHEAVELSYTVRFSSDFEFVKGGKLPGLCGGPENVSGGRRANGQNGFSARLMWRREGRGEAYLYHKNQPENYGHSFPFPEDFHFPTFVPVRVRMRVTMNHPGQRDGQMLVWITLPNQKEKLLVQQVDLEWRNTESFGIDGLYFEAFHGGSNKSWAPNHPCWAEFSDIQVKPLVREP